MQDLNDKITGSTLTAAQWNEIPSEIQQVITDSGQVLSSGDLGQLSQAIGSFSTVNKASCVTLTPINGKLYFVGGTDGGLFKGITGGSGYSDNGGSYCGTQFIPTGGDGSAAWVRVDGGYNVGLGYNPVWFGCLFDGSDDSAGMQLCYDNGKNVTFPADKTVCLINTPIKIAATTEGIITNLNGVQINTTAVEYTFTNGAAITDYRDLTYYNLNTGINYSVGDNVLTLTTAAETSNFSAGDFIFIRSEETLATPAASGNPVAELNKVLSIDGGAGTITLKYPLVKDYNYDASYTYGVANGNGEIIQGLKFYNGIINNTGKRAMSFTNLWDFEVSACTISGRSGITPRGTFINIHNNIFNIDADYSAPTWNPYIISPDTGCSRLKFHDNFINCSKEGQIHLNEALGDIELYDNTFNMGEYDTVTTKQFSLFSVAHGGWNINVYNNKCTNLSHLFIDIQSGTHTITAKGINVYDNEFRGKLGSVSSSRIINNATGTNCKISDNNFIDDPVSGVFPIRCLTGSNIITGNDVGANAVIIAAGNTVKGNSFKDEETFTVSANELDVFSGAPALTLYGGSRRKAMSFASGSDEYVFYNVALPSDVDEVDISILTVNMGAGSGDVVWSTIRNTFSDTDNTNTADTTFNVTDTASAQDVLHEVALLSNLAVSGDVLMLRIGRIGTSGSDTLANDAGITALKVHYHSNRS